LGTGRSRGARALECEDGVQEFRLICPRLGPPAAAIGRSPACRQVASGLLAHDGRL
jgi:hypothetical protein